MSKKEELKNLLKQNVASISFKKVDGTERTIKCTLKQDVVPAYESKHSSRKKPDNENVLPVWDLEKDAYRSFRIDSLISCEVI